MTLADVDDARAFCLRIERCTGLHHVECALQIGVQHRIPIGLAHAQEQPVFGHARVVHEDVHMIEVGEDLFPQFASRRRVRDIDR